MVLDWLNWYTVYRCIQAILHSPYTLFSRTIPYLPVYICKPYTEKDLI